MRSTAHLTRLAILAALIAVLSAGITQASGEEKENQVVIRFIQFCDAA